MNNFIIKDGKNSIPKKFVKFVMQEYKVQHNLLIILKIQM